ncbi:MAG: hypothetical protein H2174_03820 [Vampirovibrio sp.]|nr:hypothetical protein [Vampirovibrio sp.]
MLIQSISTQPPTRATQPANRDGFVPSASYMRSGNNSSSTSSTTDTFQLDNTIAQQITTFLETATGTRKELESQFLASVLDKHLAVGKNIDGTVKDFETAVVIQNASRVKLLAYLQTDDLDGAFRLLNGSHPPVLEKEVKWKYNPFNWVQNKMQAYVQAQPIHDDLPSELASFEAFEKHVKDLRRQVKLCLGSVEKPKGGSLLVPKTPKTIEAAIEAVTQQLEAITNKKSALTSLSTDALLDAAITHHVQASPDSAKMLEIAWFQQLLESVKNKVDGEGNSLLKNPRVQQYLQGVLLALGGGKSDDEQLLLEATIAQLAPATSTGKASKLARVPEQIVEGVISAVTNTQARIQKNMGLPAELLAQLPKALQSVEDLKTARGTFLQELMSGNPKALAFAKSQVVSPQAQEGLIQAYHLSLHQQAVQLEQRLAQLEKLPIVELPAFLKGLPIAQQRQLEAVIENILTLPPVEGMRQLKAFIAEIPQDMRGAFEKFIASKHQRFAEMREAGASAKQLLAGQVDQAFTGVIEAFNPNKIKQQLSTALEEGEQAFQTQVQAIGSVFTQVGGDGGMPPTPPVTAVLPSPPPSDGITFAKPLKVVEAQGEKLGWFPALMEQNKKWLPWAIGGTVGLGLLAWLGSWLSKKHTDTEVRQSTDNSVR